MAITKPKALKPRKTPIQSRAVVTLDAIYDAAIQVLLGVGAKRTTTIRVAERAGVSVGTLYQYHANIQSLMASVLERHLADVTRIVENTCLANHDKPIKIMLQAFVTAFIEAKTTKVDVSKALYAVSNDLNCTELVQKASDRIVKAVQHMLATATDRKIKDTKMSAKIICAAQIGPIRALLETGASPIMIDEVRRHLVLLSTGYIRQLANSR